ncbi:maleylpyruvate isomerase N-terminal domain-containing protein [Nocardia sp. CY15]|uniref:maleylpyruvate isomerase N-terminal domain-containing protein n=1 Tax=Nocardia sp. CY15 TaxID=2608687 RepID=UPI001F0D5B0A|nr:MULTISPECIES: maleylpyruvate isomerase N-terminal domain-containing protein [Nocardia]
MGRDSLCPGWTVHDVAAHLTLSNRVTLGATLAGIIRARGNRNRMTERMARDRARRYSPAQLIAQLREGAAWTRRAPGAGPSIGGHHDSRTKTSPVRSVGGAPCPPSRPSSHWSTSCAAPSTAARSACAVCACWPSMRIGRQAPERRRSADR